jgi:cytochrome bd-type quinol oxidase subunit 2
MNRLFQLSLKTASLVLICSISVFGTKAAAVPVSIMTGKYNPTGQYATLIGSNSVNAACQGAGLGQGSGCPKNSADSINKLLSEIINILSIVVGIISVIMVIVGGFKYITSGGEANKSAAASKTILYALIGLVVAVLAQVLVHFVLNRTNNAIGIEYPTITSVQTRFS